MILKHNSYFDGSVQSVGFVQKNETQMTVGAVLPGSYDFGTAGPKETITITSGSVTINGKKLNKSDSIVIETGSAILFEAEEAASYTCIYG